MTQLKIAIPSWFDRSAPLKAVGEFAQQLEALEFIDEINCWDQMGWWPRSLWSPELTPFAEIMKDPDSFNDAFIVAATAAAVTDRLGVSISTDSIRRGPGELMQTMLSLANGTEGKATVFIGAGELKQIKPFGYKRSEGLARLEDLFRLFRMFWECEEPFDFDGNIWKLRDAYVGTIRPHRPKFWAMGGGPKLIDIAVKYGDGFVTAVPNAFATPEKFAAQVALIKEELERHGRDPEAFDIGIEVMTLVHDDGSVLERAFEHPLLRFVAAIGGRMDQSKWAEEGLESPFPTGWHYAFKLLPLSMTRAEAMAVIARVPPEMVRKSFLHGSAKDVASTLQEYVDAGATWVMPFDPLPITLGLDEAAKGLQRTLDVCRILKGQ